MAETPAPETPATSERRCPDYEVCRGSCEPDECQRVGLDHPHPRYSKRWSVEDRAAFGVTPPPNRAYAVVELALSDDIDPGEFTRDMVLHLEGFDECHIQVLAGGGLPSLATWLPAKAAYDEMKARRDAVGGDFSPEYREANAALRPFGKALADIEQQLRIELLEALR